MLSVFPWRLLHLWLAIVAGLFLLIASVTGIMLAAEPVYQQSFGYDRAEADDLTVAQLLQNISSHYEEISTIKKDHNRYFQLTILDETGENTFFVDPVTGEKVAELITTPEIFDFARNLHRSLYLKKTGRLIIGLTSIVLLFICISGLFLIIKKQGGWAHFFDRVIKEDFFQDYHTKLGKLTILLILFVSLTGVVLFLDRFDLIPAEKPQHTYDLEDTSINSQQHPSFTVFKTTQLSEFKELVFPFSDFEEDYYELKLEERELLIHQKTGAIISEINLPTGTLLSNFSFKWHTGEGQSWWAIILGITSIGMLFFIFSGFVISIRRKAPRSNWHNPYPKDSCETIIAVGSELGSTAEKAGHLHEGLIKAGHKSFITTMNDFSFPKTMDNLILMTSTYGKGDAPTNATKFMAKLDRSVHNNADFQYSVVGFGSVEYPNFCQYAIELDNALQSHSKASPLLPLQKIEDKSPNDLQIWTNKISEALSLELEVDYTRKNEKTYPLKLTDRIFSENANDHTFLVELKANKKWLNQLESGDLLSITPSDHVPRYYSMSVEKEKQRILLSVKKLEGGVVSCDLARMDLGKDVHVAFKRNSSFHFPDRASEVLLISNGTGIAPFLGMLASNHNKIPVTLLWGGQNQISFDLYRSRLESLHQSGKLTSIELAYSRVGDGSKYVQDILKEKESLLVNLLKNKGVIMICGSLKMQAGVEATINEITQKYFGHSVSFYRENQQLRADCY